MLKTKIDAMLKSIKQERPVVHCITNFVTVNDCANVILACGGSPTMAHHEGEVAEITTQSDALVLNMGTVDDCEAMVIAGVKSNELRHPVIFDPVGVGASTLRANFFENILQKVHLDVIRGNVSEIKKIATGHSDMQGVDASATDQITEENIKEVAKMAKELSTRLNTIIIVSGPIDVVTNGDVTYLVRNGHEMMSQVTGTGCMSTALIGACCGANAEHLLEAALLGTVIMGISGEVAYRTTQAQCGGTMTFRTQLIDCISMLDESIVKGEMKVETFETI
ncbi:hydroxyethylthiazole kinase [Lachnospiraceae bacterium LCP25S3_G4]